MSNRPSSSSSTAAYGLQTLNETWNQVKQGIDQIYNMQGIAKQRYMQIYSDIYNYCTSVPGTAQPPNMMPRKGKAGPRDQGGGAKFVGDELYKKLKDDLRSRVLELKKSADGKTGNDMLEFFYTHWGRFRKCSVTVDGIFSYLNRNWVKRECDEGRKNIFYVYQLALNTWKEHWLRAHHDVVIPALMSEIERERRGENIIKSSYLKVIIDCYVELGFDQEENVVTSSKHSKHSSTSKHTDKLHVYEEWFEKKFLEETEHFYKNESSKFLQDNPVTAFMVKAEKRLEEERKRCTDYIHRNTEEKLIAKCQEVLIAAHLEKFWREFPNLLNDDKEDDLSRMFRLCNQIQPSTSISAEKSATQINGLDRMVEIFEEYVQQKGQDAIKSISDSVLNGGPGNQDSKLYVDTILSVHKKYYNLVILSFNNNRRFMEALDKACIKFINKNELTVIAKSNTKTPELLARYADALLKKGSKDAVIGDELEDTLCQVMTVFKYIDDKDVFQKFYSRFLSRRLVCNQSVSEDVESSMISKLKENCGFEYTTKLQRMFQDVGSSRDLNNRFQDHLTETGKSLGLDFEIKVLSSNAWPISPSSSVTIPLELERCFTVFDAFYKRFHEGRKLQFCYNNCRGELTSHFAKTRYTFQVSTYQIAVLILFNSDISYTLQQIVTATQIDLSVLNQVLAILIRAKLLLSSDSGEEAELTPESKLTLNLEYKNKRMRVNLNTQLKSEARQEQEQTGRLVEEDRSYQIQACIVRIMKTRKEMRHQKLVSEVISQLTQFKPSIPQIKKNIDILIEKEYLQRKNGERDKYEYLA